MSIHEYDSALRPPRALEELLDLFHNRPLLAALVARNVKIRYKRSVLGVFWTLAQPAAMLVVLSFVFSRVFAPHAPLYPAYAGAGLIVWYFFAQTTTVIVAEVAGGVELWRRVRMPKTAFAVATLCTGLLNLAIATLIFLAALAIARVPLGWPLLTLPVVALLAAMFALGLALLLASVALRFPDVADLYAVVLTVWMFLTPVIYPRSILPDAAAPLIALNPMSLFVEAFRSPLYENAAASPLSFASMFAVAACTLLAGWYVFARSADQIPYRG